MFFVRRGYFLIHDTDPGQWRLCKAAPLPPSPFCRQMCKGWQTSVMVFCSLRFADVRPQVLNKLLAFFKKAF